jgi:alkylation response protein AidB-like acyl-CoA dehydrogenase
VSVIDQQSKQPAELADWVARARGLAPMIQAASDRIEQDRRVTPDVMAALHEAELFRMCLPRIHGGGEASLLTVVEVMRIIAGADASTAWCMGQSLGCSLSAAFLPPDAVHEIFDPPDTVVCWGAVNAAARAVATDGGFRVTGDWNFASGIRNATWLGAHVLICEPDGAPRLNPDGKQAIRTMLWPREKATVTDVWQVIGLMGTGSDSYAVDDILVPDRHVFIRDSATDRRVDTALYRITLTQFYGAAFAGVALGIARTLLDDFTTLAGGKTASGTSRKLGENPAIQVQIAQAEARLRASHAYLAEMIGEFWDTADGGADFTLNQRARLRIASTHAINEARDVADFAYRAAGSSAILKRNPFERRFRDINAAAQQVQGQPSNLEQAGQVFLGMETSGNRL